ncbi:MAG: hypothetical protein L0Z53_06680 [Acidobacteriales bacterium]|nr:hypothetical protein [Terriglobales bacterium]
MSVRIDDWHEMIVWPSAGKTYASIECPHCGETLTAEAVFAPEAERRVHKMLEKHNKERAGDHVFELLKESK